MSSTTWNGSSSTDWATGANWSTGSVPTTGAHVVIPDTSSINNCALDTTRTIGSLTIEANGTLVGGGNKLIIQSEGDASGGTEGFAVNNDGIISGNLDLEVNTPATTTCDFNGTSGNFQNVKLNHASVDATFHTDTTFDGTLIIAAGTLKPQGGSTITVAGDTSVTGTFGVASGSGSHSFGSLTINSGGTHIATSGTTTILGSSGGFAFKNEGTFTHNSGTVKIDFETSNLNSNTRIHQTGVKEINNLEIEMNRTTDEVQFSIASGTSQGLAGNFTLTKGEAFLYTVDAHAHAFDVDGDFLVDANGTWGHLSHTGAHEFGSLRVVSGGTFIATSGTTTLSKEADTGGTDFMFHNDGTFNHNNGKFVFDDAGLSSNSAVRCSSSFYDVEITMGSFSLISHHNMNVANDFTVTTGTYSDGSNGFTITEDVNVASGATLNLSNSTTQTKTLGTISVASGATFRACRGTTTITKANGGTDGRAFYIHSSATFNHNNGLVKFTASSPQVAPTSSGQTSTSHPFYDLEQTTGTMQWKAEHHKVLNNCTMQGSAFNGSTGNVHVLGICRLTGETFNSGDTATNDNNFFQTLIVESGATLDLSAINITVGSLRNLGGTIS